MYYSDVVQTILNGKKRLRTTCLGELVKSTFVKSDIGTWSQNIGDHLILTPIIKTSTLNQITLLFSVSANSLIFNINAYGLDRNGEFEKISVLSSNINGSNINTISIIQQNTKTLYERCMNGDNFLKYQNATTWYLGLENIQAQTVNGELLTHLDFFEGNPSAMPLIGDLV